MIKQDEKISDKDSNPLMTMDLEELRGLIAQTSGEFKEGAVVKGTIVQIRKDEVLVDIRYKSEGIISGQDFGDISQYKVGDSIDVLLERLEDQNGAVVLSKQKADKLHSWEKTIAECTEGKIVKGKVFRKVKGGMMVDMGGTEAFLPASQIGFKHLKSFDEFLGRIMDFKVVKINHERKNIVLSRRQFLEDSRDKDKVKILAELKVGDVREGVVKNITDFGAFLDLNGIDGLLHITDMSWGRIGHPSEILKVGDVKEVLILDFDKEKERVSLGLKQRQPNPWDEVEGKFPVGTKVKGKVVNIVTYGVFVELEKGIEGLIHISELSWTRRINHPSEVFAQGDMVEAMVLSVDKEGKKISLGVKQTEFNPWTVVEQKYPVGTRITGLVRNITSYGAFVELEEGIDGLVHISDMTWTRKVNHPSEVLKKGDSVDALVLAVDQKSKKISLGVKQLQEDPWEKIAETYPIGAAIEGQVTKITGFGAFVELASGIEGLVHVSQIDKAPAQTIEEVLKEGQMVSAKVIRVEPAERKIALSIKEFLKDQGETS
jgi:small subunit ribosomal protein S1